jgi:hypothetical protein
MTKSTALPGNNLVPEQAAKLPAKPSLLPAARFKQAEQARNIWHAQVPSGTTEETILNPEFWPASIRNRLRIGDRIEVADDYMENLWELWVVSCDPVRSLVTLDVLFHKRRERTEMPGADKGAFFSRYEGAFDKWCVYRAADGKKMKDGFVSQSEADHAISSTFIPQMQVAGTNFRASA